MGGMAVCFGSCAGLDFDDTAPSSPPHRPRSAKLRGSANSPTSPVVRLDPSSHAETKDDAAGEGEASMGRATLALGEPRMMALHEEGADASRAPPPSPGRGGETPQI